MIQGAVRRSAVTCASLEAAPEGESVPGGFDLDIEIGGLRLRLARTPADVAASQALRYRVFYEERGALADTLMAAEKRDIDRFDDVCDHLLVIDPERDARDEVVGTYRLIRRAAATQRGGFYSASEYDIAPIVAQRGEILELGRSCVHPAYRNRPAIQLLWRGIAAYVFQHDIELLFGCASLPGTDPATLALPLSYLYHHHLAPPALRPQALPGLRVDMNLLAIGEFDPVQANAELPPLLKGYLRVGAFIGDGAVIDTQFNTTDVCIVLKTDLITGKYYRHYERRRGAPADRDGDGGSDGWPA